MKIIAIIDNKIGVGGGFNQSLSAILQMKQICKDRFEFEVFTSFKENISYLEKLGIDSTFFTYTLVDRLVSMLGISKWKQLLQRRIKYITPFEKKLINHKCDLVYFVVHCSSSVANLQKLNYITTLMDMCYRDSPEFPEARDFYEFHFRENYCKKYLAPALLILTDSTQLIDRASHSYGIDRNRFLAMPYSPSPFINKEKSKNKNEVLKKLNLEEGYFYYPAQFWAHKNHIRILQALLILAKEKKWMPSVVFSGNDHGNLSYLENFIESNRLTSQIKLLGFVSSEDIQGLYEGASAVVMPTYFGPTNLPPLEAWSIGKPLIYSKHLAIHAGDAALLIDPDDANDLAMAMYTSQDNQERLRLVNAGKKRLIAIEKERQLAEDKMYRELKKFELRRLCWE